MEVSARPRVMDTAGVMVGRDVPFESAWARVSVREVSVAWTLSLAFS